MVLHGLTWACYLCVCDGLNRTCPCGLNRTWLTVLIRRRTYYVIIACVCVIVVCVYVTVVCVYVIVVCVYVIVVSLRCMLNDVTDT